MVPTFKDFSALDVHVLQNLPFIHFNQYCCKLLVGSVSELRFTRIPTEWEGITENECLQVIMEREASNPEFGFLYNLASPEHAYYRWRLFSLAQGVHSP